MTAHFCRTFSATCYRCDLGRDEEIAAIAEEYHEVMLEPGLRGSGVPEDGLAFLRRTYIRDASADPEAVEQLYAWHARREAASDLMHDRAWNVQDVFTSNA